MGSIVHGVLKLGRVQKQQQYCDLLINDLLMQIVNRFSGNHAALAWGVFATAIVCFGLHWRCALCHSCSANTAIVLKLVI